MGVNDKETILDLINKYKFPLTANLDFQRIVNESFAKSMEAAGRAMRRFVDECVYKLLAIINAKYGAPQRATKWPAWFTYDFPERIQFEARGYYRLPRKLKKRLKVMVP